MHHQSIGSSSSSSSFFVFRTKSFRSSRRITRINSIWRRVKSFGKQTCNRHRFELILSARRESFHRILGMKRNWCFEVDWKLFWVQTRVFRDYFNNASFLLTAKEAFGIKPQKLPKKSFHKLKWQQSFRFIVIRHKSSRQTLIIEFPHTPTS